MKFSKAWLQNYIQETLPKNKNLEEIITFNAFEVEAVEAYNDDIIFDIKILPNRAHDAYGHRGMARDVAALLGSTFQDTQDYYKGEGDGSLASPTIVIKDVTACTRFMSVKIDGVQVTESPEWLKEKLQAIGQKSINSIVDITNYVQFAINKPMHAYDAALIGNNTLIARYAIPGEKLITLDDKEIVLDETTLVIADTEKPLGLAGIKGGKFSGISKDTTSVILESANFNPRLIRKTSQKYGIRTDASKRFENEISDSLIEEGLRMTISLIKKLNSEAGVSAIVDIYPKPSAPYHVGVSLSEINTILGTAYTTSEIEQVFTKLGFLYKKVIPQEEIILLGNRVVGMPYHLGASVRYDAPSMFDCSALTSWLYVHAGIRIPRMSVDQYVYTKRIESSDIRIGDLIFANNDTDPVYTSSKEYMPSTPVPQGINHVGIYIGGGNVLHATSMYEKVVVENLGTSPRFSHIVGYGRVHDNLLEERFVVTVPEERLDIRIKEDLIEEVARVKGLSTIKGVLPVLGRKGLPHKRLFYEMKIKNILFDCGFSEMYTYTFGNIGEVEIVKALSDKKKLRSSLGAGVHEAVNMNLHNAPLLGIATIKVFEFGNIFTKDDEIRHLALGIDDGKKKTSFTEEIDFILSKIKRELGLEAITYTTVSSKPYILEIDFDELILSLPEPTSYEPLSETISAATHTVSYKAVSPYPFIVRDIAVWTPFGTQWEDIHALSLQIDSPLVVRIDCFDEYTSEVDGIKKTSFAFRLVLQSHTQTLTDKEANDIADMMYSLLKEKGYEVR
jgi:phenylalanyl-tRNA synthetase beta subunit